MKKFLTALAFAAFIVVIVAACVFTTQSCSEGTMNKFIPTVKTEQVKLCLDSIVNPTFSTSEDVLAFQKTLLVNKYVDSVFATIPEKGLIDVSSVLFKKRSHVTKDDIVGEWVTNYEIYSNLPPPDKNISKNESSTTITTTEPTSIPGVVREGTTTVTEAQPTRAVEPEEPGNYKDTTINGKHALIKQ